MPQLDSLWVEEIKGLFFAQKRGRKFGSALETALGAFGVNPRKLIRAPPFLHTKGGGVELVV